MDSRSHQWITRSIDSAPFDLAGRRDFSLGNATIRPSLRRITTSTGDASLEPRVMQVLIALSDADGFVLSRDTLMEMCWSGVIVGDDAVNRAIGELRRAVRDVDASFAIETIARVGYRLNVCAPERQTPAPPSPIDNARDYPSAMSRRRLVAGSAGLVAAAMGGFLLWRERSDPTDKRVEALVAESEQAFRLGLPASDRQGIAMIEKAIAMQPQNATLWGRLALARSRANEHALSGVAGSASMSVQDAARRALSLDPNEVNAHAALAMLLPYYGDWAAAEQRFDAVLARDPRHLPTLDSRAFFLNAVGRTREGALARVAFAPRDPFDAGLQFRLIYCLWMLGRIGEADRAASRGMELWPKHPGMWFGRLWLMAGTGRADRALAQVEDVAGRPPLKPPMLNALGASLRATVSGDAAAVQDAVVKIMAPVSQNPGAVVNAMMLLNVMGALDQAFALAEAYYLERGPLLAAVQWRRGQALAPDQLRRKTNMLFVPSAERMRADPRFLPLIEDMGLMNYWREAGVSPDFLALDRTAR